MEVSLETLSNIFKKLSSCVPIGDGFENLEKNIQKS